MSFIEKHPGMLWFLNFYWAKNSDHSYSVGMRMPFIMGGPIIEIRLWR